MRLFLGMCPPNGGPLLLCPFPASSSRSLENQPIFLAMLLMAGLEVRGGCPVVHAFAWHRANACCWLLSISASAGASGIAPN